MRKHPRCASGLPNLKLPAVQRVTAEELEPTCALFCKVMRLREEIGPIGIPVDELIHQVRTEGHESQRDGPRLVVDASVVTNRLMHLPVPVPSFQLLRRIRPGGQHSDPVRPAAAQSWFPAPWDAIEGK